MVNIRSYAMEINFNMKHILYGSNKNIKYNSQDKDIRWSSVHWAKINKNIEKLRSQIYLAKLQGNDKITFLEGCKVLY
jgi:hypothetical protein